MIAEHAARSDRATSPFSYLVRSCLIPHRSPETSGGPRQDQVFTVQPSSFLILFAYGAELRVPDADLGPFPTGIAAIGFEDWNSSLTESGAVLDVIL